MNKKTLLRTALLLLLACAVIVGCASRSGHLLDEAKVAQRAPTSFNAADEDFFRDMDSGIELTPAEVQGRNTWLVWTGGNDRFWDLLSTASVGNLDFLKVLSSHPNLRYSRDTRWNYFGLVNEPCFGKPTGPDPERFGLWLDQRGPGCSSDPFENAIKYPGVALGARGKNLEAGSFYGYATGIVGLRLFPNPAFNAAAAKQWDPKRYYEDPTYYLSKELVRPYRVGMSCAFCHVGPNPVKPPEDPEHPKWENLSANVGAQYFWIDRIFSWDADRTNFVYQIFHTSRPGSLDTSLVSSDNINNPRTMNAVYALGARLGVAKRWGQETIAGGGLNNKQFNDFVKAGPLTEFYQAPATVLSPRVLKDGSDSVGALGALNRVYLNIGLFSEEWLTHFNPLIGGKTVSPIEIAVARRNSSYWQATEQQTANLALFFLKSTAPHKLADAPGGSHYLSTDEQALTRGKEVFAERCARCHSSKIPTPARGLDPRGCSGSGYLDCWNRYWAWTKSPEFKNQMRDIVMAGDFLDNNFLSTDVRVPVTLLKTNACSPLATNAIENNIWDNFSSRTYKDLPSVGSITVYHPVTGEPFSYEMPAGGRGYTRPASLVSVWSTAPFLLNNTVGRFDPSPSVDARMRSFDDSIHQLLWPETRDQDEVLGTKVPGRMDRTTNASFLRVPSGYLPSWLANLREKGQEVKPWLWGPNGLEIGPIPKGTPVNLLANLNLRPDNASFSQHVAHDKKLLSLLLKVKSDLKALPKDATDEQAAKVLGDLVDPLLAMSKCPDFIVNRGHYFGTRFADDEPGLPDADKLALIEYLKHF